VLGRDSHPKHRGWRWTCVHRPASAMRRGPRRRRSISLCVVVMIVSLLTVSVPAWATLFPDYRTGQYEPSAFCPANDTCFSHAHWVEWTHSKAVAIATMRDSCPGAGPNQKCPSGRRHVELYRPRNVCGGLRYTRARTLVSMRRVGGLRAGQLATRRRLYGLCDRAECRS
jgi:hypothetical protein